MSKPIDQTLFESDMVEMVDTGVLHCHDATLKVPLGSYNPGEEFELVVINFHESYLSLHQDEDERGERYELGLAVGRKL